jgi:ubiquinone/menaquinone biosynthesis C-methylase UbiE
MGIRTSPLTRLRWSRPTVGLACVVLLAAAAAAAQTRAEKDALEDAARLIELLGITAGQTVADVGAGPGTLTVAMARQVGPNGRVYATELGEKNIATLQAVIEREKLPQVTVLAGAFTSTNLPDACCDAIFTRLVYHHFAEPAPMNASILKALKPGGRYGIIEFLPGRGAPEAKNPADRANNASHGVGPESVERELKEAGFESVSVSPVVGRGFTVVASRPAK